MKFRLLFKIILSSSIILFIAGGLGYISVSRLKRNAQLIVEDTLPGLAYAGAANAYVADASRTLQLIVTDEPDKRDAIRAEISTLSARTTGYLTDYAKQIFSEEDRRNYETLVVQRENYIKVRERVVALAMDGKRDEALAMYENELVPAHKSVKESSDRLFEYNMRQAAVRGRNIMGICTVTQISVGIMCVLVFLIGFFIGLFK